MARKIQRLRGYYQVYSVCERTGKKKLRCRGPNEIAYDWAIIACQAIGLGKSEYKIGGMYVEFENTASPGLTVSPPTIDRAEGREYYDNLSGNRDYLRIPLLSLPALSVAPGWNDYFSGTGVDFNRMTFAAQTSGNSGSNGLTFSHLTNSRVFGIALVATPEWADRTQDVVFARGYYPAGDQLDKEASHQLYVSWRQDLA